MSDKEIIASGDVINCGLNKTGKGTFIKLLLNDGPDDNFDKLLTKDIRIGDVLNIEITKPDYGA